MRKKRRIGVIGWLFILAFAVLFTAAIFVFAWQTWEFVNFLLPSENWLMKYLAVGNFDIMSLVWMLGELVLFHWLTDASRVTMGLAGGIDFFLSTCATVIQLTVISSLRFGTPINPVLIYVAYGIIAFALVVNLISFIIVIRSQWPYIIGEKSFDEDGDRAPQPENKPAPSTPTQPPTPPRQWQGVRGMAKTVWNGKGEPNAQPATASEQTFTKAEVAALVADAIRAARPEQVSPLATDPDLSRWKALYDTSGESGLMSFSDWFAKMQRAQSPLATAPLNTTASQPGQANGHAKTEAK